MKLNGEVRIALVYFVLGCIWIFLTDHFLALLITDSSTLTNVQSYKGWFFVAASTFLIYFLLKRYLASKRQAELKQIESEEQYRLLFETSLDAVFLTSPNGKILAANPAACKLFGRSEKEICNLGRNALVDTSDPRLAPALEERMKNGYFSGVLTFKRNDGTKFEGEISTALFNDSNGNLRTSMILRDITDRKRAEEVIKKKQQELQHFIEHVPAAIAMFDKEMRYLCVSQQFFSDYRIEERDIIHKSHYEIFPEISENVKEIHRRCLKGETISNDEEPFPRLDRRVDWVRWEVLPWYENNGEIGGIILFSEVITKRKLIEERIKTQLYRLKTLREIDQAIVASNDIHVVLNTLIEMLLSSLRVDAVDVLLLDPATNTLTFAVEKGFLTPKLEKFSVHLGTGLLGQIALGHERLFVPDLRETSQQLSRPWLLTDEKFVSYGCAPLFIKGELKGVLEVFHRSLLNPDAEWLDFLDSLAGQAAIAIDNARVNEGLRSANLDLTLAYDATLEGWSRALDMRDKETEGHTERVTQFTLEFAKRLGISEEERVHIRRGALLHDIGKLGIPDHILLKPAELTEEEWEIMRKHPVYAFGMLAPIAYLRPAMDIPYCHHEKWDGSGYPRGLKGEQIPLAARLFAVVDMWDALRSERPYRKAWPEEKALEYIRAQSGSHFDPKVVEVFLQMMAE